MTRCIHTGLSIPECSCRACLLELVRTHAPGSVADATATPPRPADAGLQRPQAA